MFGEEIDVIGDEHHVTDAHFGSKAARSVGNKEGFDAQFVHDANGESHLLHVIPLVVVETSLHGKHFFTAQTAKKETTGVTFYRGNGEMGDVSVRKLLDDFDFFCEATETGAEYYRNGGAKCGVGANPLSSCLNLF